MYQYIYDANTGGILLKLLPTGFSKEPRPVYARELDILGFDKYWKYNKQLELPYMWSEANTYWYRGKMVAKLKGGNIFTKPKIMITKDEKGNPVVPEPNGNALQPVDISAMVKANRDILTAIEEITKKRILAIYNKYQTRVDFFNVAFSGGKDSAVLLDLVRETLPTGSFEVLFSDTEMEYSDTYETIWETQQALKEEGIPLYIARSHYKPQESWKLFGPPSRTLRWCCSVHKSTPQVLKLKEIAGKDTYTGLVFVGVRSHESARRAGYEFENYGKKQKGQYSHNSILDWTSAEVWLYMYTHNLYINKAYKKGCARVGCLCCPMGGGKASFIEYANYSKEMDWYLSCIQNSDERIPVSPKTYFTKGGWSARKSGAFLIDNENVYSEITEDDEIKITVISPKTNWKEWMGTLGDLVRNGNQYTVVYRGESFNFTCEPRNNGNGYIVKIPSFYTKKDQSFVKLFRYTFRKAAYCVSCGTCQANCKNGCISFYNGLKITNCHHCSECYSMSSGCLAYDSLKISKRQEAKKSQY